MDSTILFLFIFVGITILLLVVCVALLISLKKNRNDGAIFDELRYNREEMSNASRMSREEVTKGLEKVDLRLNALREENYKSRIDMTEKITESLNVIRQNNIEQNDRQTRFIVESVAKLQESNEKKLEEMRVTVDEKLTLVAEKLWILLKTMLKQVLQRKKLKLMLQKQQKNQLRNQLLKKKQQKRNQLLKKQLQRKRQKKLRLNNSFRPVIPSQFYKVLRRFCNRKKIEYFLISFPIIKNNQSLGGNYYGTYSLRCRTN